MKTENGNMRWTRQMIAMLLVIFACLTVVNEAAVITNSVEKETTKAENLQENKKKNKKWEKKSQEETSRTLRYSSSNGYNYWSPPNNSYSRNNYKYKGGSGGKSSSSKKNGGGSSWGPSSSWGNPTPKGPVVQVRNLGNGECLDTTSLGNTIACTTGGSVTQNFIKTDATISNIMGAFQLRQAAMPSMCLGLTTCETGASLTLVNCLNGNTDFFTTDQGSTLSSASCFGTTGDIISSVQTDGNAGGVVNTLVPGTGVLNENFVFVEVPKNPWGGNGGW